MCKLHDLGVGVARRLVGKSAHGCGPVGGKK